MSICSREGRTREWQLNLRICNRADGQLTLSGHNQWFPYSFPQSVLFMDGKKELYRDAMLGVP